ncbi:WD repeat-containing and planar cell polarity effector protein fritz homolog isoform X1 [Callorhinchus milii]|uniref:WD repeat-containing and planar cell polarity effector protein fritz homolog isoform X1 n=1 Tax=Callorhinchus milii TaxID=7868 RepID=UPI001C3F6C63|nr:WD repeat-containing and planar cell polarity effector protein fritz homolog isoform X1 [Callorhinchus milii]XP_007890536.2 WD repeat-containing and planar cell polarity effector protein fritz homolog isoform X1 [Callorhinchus milii]XP_007890537.2 WD repeat-containing and planar cell polarity effector protein fritz homolog isoform X1 [Callorhinchus milii]
MSFCLTELHLWSMRNTLHVKDTDIGTYQYYDKGEAVSPADYCYLEEKQHMTESREYLWTPKNRRPDKLRDTLKEFEELLQCSRCILSKWKNKNFCQLFFGSGVLVSISLSGPHLEKVTIDRTLVGRLIADTITDAVLADNFLILAFLENSKLCFVQFTKKSGSPDISRRVEKLSSSDLKISYVDLPGLSGRRLEHRLAINCMQDMVICWWKTANGDAWPWSPISSESDRANLVLLNCMNSRLEVLSFIRTENDPLDAGFSINQPYQIHTVECSIGPEKEPMADSCIYECARNRLQRVTVTSVPLKSRATCCSRNNAEDKLVMGCENSSVILYDAHRRLTLLAQTELMPSSIEWHPEGAIIVVSSSQGEIQCYDMALSPVKIQLLAEDITPTIKLQLSQHFAVTSRLAQIQWTVPQVISPSSNSLNVHDLMFLRFDKGPVGVLCFKLGAIMRGQLGPTELIRQYIRHEQIDEAINILCGMNWNTLSSQCYACLIAIVDHLLKQKLTLERESQLESSLGTFYAPTRPLSDITVLEYRDPISRYARRFFHHLLRYQRFEKAFLLAVDIGARDLFMDIYYLALDKGEMALAEVAKKKANEIDTESITTEVETLKSLDGVESLTGYNGNLSLATLEPDRPGGNRPSSRPASDTAHLFQSDGQNNPCDRPSYHSMTSDMESKLGIDAYAAALRDDPLSWILEGNPDDSEGETQEIGSSNTLKVVHFGLV